MLLVDGHMTNQPLFSKIPLKKIFLIIYIFHVYNLIYFLISFKHLMTSQGFINPSLEKPV